MNAPVELKAIEGMFKRHYKQIEVRFDPEHAVAWTYMKPSGAPCFNLDMLEELRAHDSAIESCASRVGMKRAEEMILSGRVYTAEELHEAGIVDVLAEDGTGEAAVRDYIRRNERRRNGMQAVFSCRQHFHPVTHEELLNIANVWVSAALRLEDKDLKLMSRLARSQAKLVPGGAAARPDAVEIREEMQYATA